MKKIILLISIFLISGCSTNKAFYLNDEYYLKSEFVEINNSELKELENNNESFAIVVYNSNCLGSANFIKVVKEYLETNEIKIYRILGKNINDTKISKKIKYLPTMVIYKNGKIINYLDTEKEEHLKYYEDVSSFKSWFEKQILIK